MALQNTEEWAATNDKIGREQFQAGQHQEAVNTYTKIISNVRHAEKVKNRKYTSTCFRMFDARAAAFEKLGDCEKAARDAECMIRLCPRNLRGYMRKARVQIISKKPLEARDTYRKGLQVCDEDDPSKKFVVDALQKLREKINTGKYSDSRRDPAELPMEVQHIIFGSVPFEELLRWTRVSRSWRRAIFSLRKMQTTIDLSLAKRSISPKSLNSMIQRVRQPIQLVISTEFVRSPLRAGLERYIVKSESIRELSISGEHHMPVFLRCYHNIDAEASSLAKAQLLCKACSTAKWARHIRKFRDTTRPSMTSVMRILSSCPNLESLIISGPNGFGFGLGDGTDRRVVFPGPDGWDLMPRQPVRIFKANFMGVLRGNTSHLIDYIIDRGRETLTELSLSHFHYRSSISPEDADPNTFDLRSLCSLQKLWFSSLNTDTKVLLPPSLKHLHIDDSSFRSHFDPSLSFPSLETINIFPSELSRGLPRYTLAVIFHSIPHTDLRTLRLGQYFDLEQVKLLLSTGIFIDIQTLKISLNFPQADDIVVDDLIPAAPQLRTLDLSYSQITGYSIKKLVERCKHLKELDFSFCDKVGLDTRGWLERTNVVWRCAGETETGTGVRGIHYEF